jgi:hypothetical protein
MESMSTLQEQFPFDRDNISDYAAFAEAYGIEDLQQLVQLYDIHELRMALPQQPTTEQAQALRSCLGATGNAVYLDYYRSNNTFELIMQYHEAVDSQWDSLQDKFGFDNK